MDGVPYRVSGSSRVSYQNRLPMFTCAADRIGRRPVILVGLVGTAISTLLFGLSGSFLTVVLSRAMGKPLACAGQKWH